MKKAVRKLFPLKDGVKPKHYDKLFLDGFFAYSFSNTFGEYYIAYINQRNGDIWLAGSETDWKWISTTDRFILNDEEAIWFKSLLFTRNLILENIKYYQGFGKNSSSSDSSNVGA